MKFLSHTVLSKGVAHGTGWLPGAPDLRDYSDQHEEIQGILEGMLRGGDGEKGGKGEAEKEDSNVQSRIDPVPSTQYPVPIVDLRQYCSPIEDQGQLGSCTAHAAAGIVEYYERRAFGNHIECSRLFLYKTTRNLMQTKGDTGAWIRCTMGALVLCGIPDEKYWPYNASKFDKEPSAFVYSVANNYQAVKYFRHDIMGREQGAGGKGQIKNNSSPGNKLPAPRPLPPAPASAVLASVKKYLEAGIPSMFGFWGFGSFDKSDVPGGIPYPAETEAAQWGHAVAAFGYDDSKKITNLVNNKSTTGALLFRNSWGKEWGEKGYGWLPYDYVLNGLAEDFWSLVSMDWVEKGEFGF